MEDGKREERIEPAAGKKLGKKRTWMNRCEVKPKPKPKNMSTMRCGYASPRSRSGLSPSSAHSPSTHP
jgi:hypothetical protein